MSSLDPVRLVGAPGSPYTQKMVALLRYRRIPYQITWGDPAAYLDALGVGKPKPIFMPTFLFDNDEGGVEGVCDSTPIIRRLESLYPGRSVLPADAALAFIDYLIEDFADEWCTKYMFHYRWYPERDADNAGTMLPLGMDVSLPTEAHATFKEVFSKRQIDRLYVVGSNDTTAPVIDASYRRYLKATRPASNRRTVTGSHRKTSPTACANCWPRSAVSMRRRSWRIRRRCRRARKPGKRKSMARCGHSRLFPIRPSA